MHLVPTKPPAFKSMLLGFKASVLQQDTTRPYAGMATRIKERRHAETEPGVNGLSPGFHSGSLAL